jgi:FlaA1/EpsC-like NDP-sugar epimerase
MGKVIHGLRVFGGNGDLQSVCREQQIEEVLLSSSRMSEERIREIQRSCQEEQIAVKRMRIRIEEVAEEGEFDL